MPSNKNCYYAVLLCIFATSCYHIASSLSPDDDKSIFVKYEKWMAEYGIYYKNEGEKMEKFKIFSDNVKYIDRFNQEGNHTYELGINIFADLTHEEFLARYGGNLIPTIEESARLEPFHYVPTDIDWRDHNAVTPVKNQGHCGCCWIFTAVAAIEGITAIKTGKLASLSEQNVLDCNYNHEGCNGGQKEHVFDFVKRNGGLASESSYPYTAAPGACAKNKPSSLPTYISGFNFVQSTNETALKVAVARQPVSVTINPKLFQFYHSGILSGDCGINNTHAVTIVGYGETRQGEKYWIIKNSWSANWGDGGFMKIKRDVNMCGIAAYPSYPTV